MLSCWPRACLVPLGDWVSQGTRVLAKQPCASELAWTEAGGVSSCPSPAEPCVASPRSKRCKCTHTQQTQTGGQNHTRASHRMSGKEGQLLRRRQAAAGTGRGQRRAWDSASCCVCFRRSGGCRLRLQEPSLPWPKMSRVLLLDVTSSHRWMELPQILRDLPAGWPIIQTG